MNNVMAIALTTYRESIRSKVLYSVVFFAILLVVIAAMFGRVTIGDPTTVLKDFGLMSISFFSVAFAVINGGNLLHKELARKTIYNILSKAVARWEFLLGKYLGMVVVVMALVGLLGLILSALLFLYEGRFDLLLLEAYLFILFELLIVSAAAIFFSSIVVTPLLSGLFTFGIFLAGRSTDYILKFAEGSGDAVSHSLYWILPHLNWLNISNGIVYGEGRSLENMFWSFLYAAGYSLILLVLANWAFQRREFN
jgi:ABC-type transport system involved in multi-copper enzyme maturation permease subunit